MSELPDTTPADVADVLAAVRSRRYGQVRIPEVARPIRIASLSSLGVVRVGDPSVPLAQKVIGTIRAGCLKAAADFPLFNSDEEAAAFMDSISPPSLNSLVDGIGKLTGGLTQLLGMPH